MSGWRRRDEQNNGQSGHLPSSQAPAGVILSLSQAASAPPAAAAVPPDLTAPTPAAVPQFCPECGGRLNSSTAYVPKFCTLCGHRLAGAAAPVPLSGLDALLAATAAAKADGAAALNDPANVTYMGASQTLMGVPRNQLYTQTLMGVSRDDLYSPPPSRARVGSTRARIQEARRAGAAPTRTRSVPPSNVPPPLETRYVALSEMPTLPAAAPPAPTPAPVPEPAPAPVLEPRPPLLAKAPRTETRQASGEGMAAAVFTTLLLLAVCAAAATFWLVRQGILALPF